MLGVCSDLLLQQQQQQTVRIVGREQQSCSSSIICCYCNPKSSTRFSRSSQSLAFVSRSRIAAASKEDGAVLKTSELLSSLLVIGDGDFGGEIVSSTLLSVCTPDFGMQMRMQVLERGGFQAGKQKVENPSVLISAINLARILPDAPRNQKSRGGFWLPHQPQLQQRYILFCSLQ